MKFLRPLTFALLLLSPAITGAWAADAPGSFAYVLQADAFARTKAAAVSKLAVCGRDWIVLDAVYSSNEPWAPADLGQIRAGRAGRKLLAYLSIGEAEDYRPYWQSAWVRRGRLTDVAPGWLGRENPDWKGNYQVRYWDADWQALMLEAVDAALASGFDGVYLDIVDAFETYEQNGDAYIDDRQNPETGQSYRRDMVDWVKIIAARARSQNTAALVVPQNGTQLLGHADFLDTISAVGVEDLFTEGNRVQSAAHTDEVLGNLLKLAEAQKPALVIEYPKSAPRRALSQRRATENGLVWLITDRQLKTLGQSGR